MRNLVTILLITQFAIVSKSQNIKSIQIINCKTKHGIPFVTIKSKLTNKIISSNQNGFAEIQITDNDSILISSIGYVSLICASSKIQMDTIFELTEYYQILE